jgi:hypothetical protein
LSRLFELHTDYRDIVLDLKYVSMVGRDGMGFLARCEADGVKLRTAVHIFANGFTTVFVHGINDGALWGATGKAGVSRSEGKSGMKVGLLRKQKSC